MLPLAEDETRRDVIIDVYNQVTNLDLYMKFDCDSSKVKAYSMKLEELPEGEPDTKLIKTEEYKCGSNFIVNGNKYGAIVLIVNDGSTTINYSIGKLTSISGTSLGAVSIIAIVVGVLAVIGLGVGYYIHRRKKLQSALN